MADSVLSSVLPNNSIRSLIPRDEESTVYVDNASNLAQREDIIPNNDVINTFTTAALGSTSVFRLSKSVQFLGQMFIRFNITIAGGNSNFTSDYPAYKFIKTVKYVVGSTEQLILYGESMLDLIHEQCEDNDDKKLLIHELAGYKVMAAGTYNLYAFLPLPWSSIKANKLGQNQKPFPIHALNDNIEIQIELNDATAVGIANLSTGSPLSAALLYKYMKIGNHEQLVREKIRYPFKQPINVQQFSITAGNDISNYLTNFRKGECTDIMLHLAESGATGDKYAGKTMTDIKLFFNGVRIWNANNSDRCWDMLCADQPSTYGAKRLALQNITGAVGIAANQVLLNQIGVDTGVAVASGTFVEVNGYTNDGAGAGGKQYYYVIPFGEIRLKMLESGNNYALSGDFSRQSLQLVFNTTFSGILYVSYVYTGIYEIDENGSCILAF